MYYIFEKLLKEHGVTAYRVAKETGVSTATLTEWKNGNYTPKQDKLQKIADYFNVTLDYLSGREEPIESMDSIDLGSVKLNRIARQAKDLTESDQDVVLSVIEAMRKAKQADDKNDDTDEL